MILTVGTSRSYTLGYAVRCYWVDSDGVPYAGWRNMWHQPRERNFNAGVWQAK